MTIRDNLRFAAGVPWLGPRSLQVHRRINELLETFDLTALTDRKPAQLSGGQKQRAALARILLTEPRLLLLDEPSRGLDADLRGMFWDLLRSIRLRVQIPIVLVTHDLEECCELADFVTVLEEGRILQSGTRQEVLEKPVTVAVARLLGIYNIAPAEIRFLDPAANRSRLLILGQEIEGPYLPGHLIGDNGFLCVRRSEMKSRPQGREKSNDQLTLRIQARHASPFGVRLMLENEFSAVISEVESSKYADQGLITLSTPASAMTFIEK